MEVTYSVRLEGYIKRPYLYSMKNNTMKKIANLTILLSLLISNLFSQNLQVNIDSLIKKTNSFIERNNCDSSLIYANKVVKESTKQNNYITLTRGYNLLSITSNLMSDYNKSNYYLQKALFQKENSFHAMTYNLLGAINKDNLKREFYYKKSVDLSYKYNCVERNLMSFGNLLGAYLYNKRDEKLILPLIDKINNIKAKHPVSEGNIGAYYFEIKQYNKALPYIKNAYNLSNDIYYKRDLLNSIAVTYDSLKDYKNANSYHIQYIILSDSCHKTSLQKSIMELNSKYEVESKNNDIETLSNRNKNLIYGLVFVLILSLIVGIGYNNIKKQRNLINNQKLEIEEKNKNIIDSINYAEGIQKAILPIIGEDNVFIYFQPKDIVSGDFYWKGERENIKYYAVCDCTGHGIPGALLSVLCSQLLNEGLKLFSEPHNIINYVKQQLEIKMTLLGRNDGMELALISIKEEKVSYCGIKRPLYIVSNNELKTYKPEDNKTIVLNLNQGDMIYMTTDGYIDQYGVNGKKFSSKELKRQLVLCSTQTCKNQLEMFKLILDFHKQDVEQTDDILLMGIKI